jgi:CHRD domain
VRTGRARLMAIALTICATVAATATASSASANGDEQNLLRERLSGYEEDPLVLSTAGAGQLWLQISSQPEQIAYRLSYTGLEGTVTQAHIHFGGKAQSGGIVVFLCSNLGNGPAGTQECPAAPATITGTIRPADVIGPTGQGIAAGQFTEFVDTYVNVHSTSYPGGEIRAQLGH